MSGPHFSVATPLNKTPKEVCRHNLDYCVIDLIEIPDNYIPRTNYTPGVSKQQFIERIPSWQGKAITESYRHIHRRMLSQTGERTLISAIAPPEVTYLNFVFSINFESNTQLVEFSGLCSSIVYDFYIKTTGKGDLQENLAKLLPLPELHKLSSLIIARTLRLNCLTRYYADLWKDLYKHEFIYDNWTRLDTRLNSWGMLSSHWQRDIAFRTPFERRQALVEIDVLAAMALGLTLDELLTIYRVQFPVLQKNERRLLFDQRGMEVPVKTVQGELIVNEDREKFPEMVPPFTPVDREGDYRQAWAHFEGRVASD